MAPLRIFVAAGASLAISQAASAAHLELKGLALDATIDCGELGAGGEVTGGPCSSDSDAVQWHTTLATQPATLTIALDPAGPDGAQRIRRIEAKLDDPRAFPMLEAALTEKFGKPDARRGHGGGMVTWSDGDITLRGIYSLKTGYVTLYRMSDAKAEAA